MFFVYGFRKKCFMLTYEIRVSGFNTKKRPRLSSEEVYFCLSDITFFFKVTFTSVLNTSIAAIINDSP